MFNFSRNTSVPMLLLISCVLGVAIIGLVNLSIFEIIPSFPVAFYVHKVTSMKQSPVSKYHPFRVNEN
jgi:hypothetical protein